jgi:hypothetical protein
VSIYGGSMSAGAAEGGGFVLAARLPLRELEPAALTASDGLSRSSA